MTELWQLDAAQLARGYATFDFTPLQALNACLERAQQWEPHINAMVCMDQERAREAAARSALRWAAGAQIGPLDGVPLTLKDNLHAAGLPTTWGSRLLKGPPPCADERPVAHLRAGGALIFGKTNLPEFAMQGYTANAVAGVTRNPWDTSLTPGGSSGGAAAAVAAGCGPLALCTDGGGSARRPASHCGLVGFKPSAGFVPRAGGLPGIFLDYEVVGTIGRTVHDVGVLAQVAAGRVPTAPPAAQRNARILYVPRFGASPVDADIAALTRRAAGHFAALGHRIEEADHFDLANETNALWPLLSQAGLAWMLSRAAGFPEFGLAPGESPDLALCGESLRDAHAAGVAKGATGLFEALAAIHRLRRELDDLFTQHDYILTPAAAALPWPAQQTHPATIDGQRVGPRGHGVFTAMANAAELPAIALPCGQVRGLPVGLQLVGRGGADLALMSLARQYEQAQPWQGRWPTPPASAS